MVREVYSHNRIFTPAAASPATLNLLFKFTGLSGGIIGDLAPNPPTGRTPIAGAVEQLDHRLAPLSRGAGTPIAARRATCNCVAQARSVPGAALARPAGQRPASPTSLAFRNLRRGVMLGLPSGQDVAQAMKIKNPLTPDEIAEGDRMAPSPRSTACIEDTPLWYYILKEAEQRGNGERLGPGRRDASSRRCSSASCTATTTSYLWLKGKNWKPTPPSKVPGDFTMADLLRFVGDISPIDDIKTV